METPKRATTRATWSKMEYCFVAEMTPAVTPMMTATTTLMKASLKVVGNFATISLVTDWPVV